MKVIKYTDIRNSSVSMDTMIGWVYDALRNKNQSILPPKTSLKPEDNVFFNFMPCIIPEMQVAGVKVVSRHPNDNPALKSNIMLFDLNNGTPLAVLDGDFITTARTGIVAAITVKELARKDFGKISVVGLGNTARATVDALAAIFKDRELNISLLEYKDQAELFMDRFKDVSNLHFTVEKDIDEMFASSDVIISCVSYADSQFTNVDNYKPGCLVVPVHTRGFQNCDDVFDLVVCDDIAHISGFGKFNEMKVVRELSTVISEGLGRTSDSERILAYNIGIALHDIYFAKCFYEQGLGIENIDFESPVDKFWW